VIGQYNKFKLSGVKAYILSHLQPCLKMKANQVEQRIHLIYALPTPAIDYPVIQPLKGVIPN